MPFKSEAQRRWMYANHPRMAREWSAHTPKGKNLPEKVKQAYQDGEENKDESSFLENYLKATAGHKLVDSGLSHLIRKNNLFSNYYANAAREGINAALTGLDVAPTMRQGLGIVSPTITGLGSYETAKQLAAQLKNTIEKETGQKITSIDQLINHPIAKEQLGKIQGSGMSSMTRDITNALNPNLPASKVVDAIKRYGGVGADNQRHSALVGGAISAGLGGLTGGSAGALGAMTANAPDLAALHMIQSGNAQPIMDLKKRVMARGAAHGVTGPGLAQTATSLGLGALSPLSHEVYGMGEDIGRPVGQKIDKVLGGYQKFTKPFNFIPGKQRLDQFAESGADKLKQNLASKVENALLSPNLTSRIKGLFRK